MSESKFADYSYEDMARGYDIFMNNGASSRVADGQEKIRINSISDISKVLNTKPPKVEQMLDTRGASRLQPNKASLKV